MDYQIERLKAEDYDELLAVLNRAFQKKEGAGFETDLPVMWERDDEHMGKHVAIRIEGKIAAAVGIYPLPAVVAGRPMMFGTVGNVATLPEYSGMGLMKQLVTFAMNETKRLGFDAVRLGGKRQRYNRYGFENGGVDYQYWLTKKNLLDYYGGKEGEKRFGGSSLSGGLGLDLYLSFRQVTGAEDELLDFVKERQESAEMYVERGDRKQLYHTLSAWNSKIWVAFAPSGEPVGYLCVSEDGRNIAEHGAISAQESYQMICEWVLFSGVEEVLFHTAPWECELNQMAGKVCEKWCLADTNHFNPHSWRKLLDALLQIKAKYWEIPAGGVTVEIEGYGTVAFEGTHCVDSDKEPQLKMTHLDAVRCLLGSMPVSAVIPQAALEALPAESKWYLQSVFPLPLWWSNQDRV